MHPAGAPGADTRKVRAQRSDAPPCVTRSIYSLPWPRPLPHDLSDDPIPTWSEENVTNCVPTSARTAPGRRRDVSDYKPDRLRSAVADLRSGNNRKAKGSW